MTGFYKFAQKSHGYLFEGNRSFPEKRADDVKAIGNSTSAMVSSTRVY